MCGVWSYGNVWRHEMESHCATSWLNCATSWLKSHCATSWLKSHCATSWLKCVESEAAYQNRGLGTWDLVYYSMHRNTWASRCQSQHMDIYAHSHAHTHTHTHTHTHMCTHTWFHSFSVSSGSGLGIKPRCCARVRLAPCVKVNIYWTMSPLLMPWNCNLSELDP